jgi:hypothetical protein
MYPEMIPQRRSMAESSGRSGSSVNGTRSWNDLRPEVKDELDELVRMNPGMDRKRVLATCKAEHFKR